MAFDQRLFSPTPRRRDEEYFAPPTGNPGQPGLPSGADLFQGALASAGPARRRSVRGGVTLARPRTPAYTGTPLQNSKNEAILGAAGLAQKKAEDDAKIAEALAVAQAQADQPSNPANEGESRPGDNPNPTAPADDVGKATGTPIPKPNRERREADPYAALIKGRNDLYDEASKHAEKAAIFSSWFTPAADIYRAKYQTAVDRATGLNNEAVALAQAYAAEVQAEMKKRSEAEAYKRAILEKEYGVYQAALTGVYAHPNASDAEGHALEPVVPRFGEGLPRLGHIMRPVLKGKGALPPDIQGPPAVEPVMAQPKDIAAHNLVTTQGTDAKGNPVVRVMYLDTHGNKRTAELPGSLGQVAAKQVKPAGAKDLSYAELGKAEESLVKTFDEETKAKYNADPKFRREQLKERRGIDFDQETGTPFMYQMPKAKEPEQKFSEAEIKDLTEKGINGTLDKDMKLKDGRTIKAGTTVTWRLKPGGNPAVFDSTNFYPVPVGQPQK